MENSGRGGARGGGKGSNRGGGSRGGGKAGGQRSTSAGKAARATASGGEQAQNRPPLAQIPAGVTDQRGRDHNRTLRGLAQERANTPANLLR